MSTVVWQGFQSCLESQPIETTTLRLKLATPKSIGLTPALASDTNIIRENCLQENINNKTSSNPEVGTWSFLHSLSKSSQITQTEKPYVHPYVKPSPFIRLSEKSLELCTESLGSENGSDSSDISCDLFDFSSIDSLNKKSSTNPRRNILSRKVNPPNFPPPLTSISGSSSLQVRTHREGGRLVMEAVRVPPTQTCFKAERSDGRLRLSFLKNYDSDQQNEGNETVESQEDEEEYEEQCDESYIGEEMDGNSGEVMFGMEKFGRPSRCKESGHGGKGLSNWEPLWVATS